MSRMGLGIEKSIKRFIDIFLALLALIAFLPLWLIVCLLIKIDSPGKVLFLHKRPGYKTKIFRVYKFRTMRLGSEKMIRGKEVTLNDERITRIGKLLRRFKIDEVPQILNVLKGEMSIVGPRPEREDYLLEYTEEELKRFNMKPGLTGLSQVSGSIYLTLEERHRLDVWYVENFSLWLDFKIILKTIPVVLLGEKRFVKEKQEETSDTSLD